MKRFFFTVIALSAVAVGCTKSGLLESPQTYESPISFEPYTGKAPVTKATIESNTTITSGFRVIGFVEGTDNAITATSPYLHKFVRFGDHDGDKATAETPTPDTWFYSGAMYWPEGKELTFVAYGLNVNGTPAEALNTDGKYLEGDAAGVTGEGVKFAQAANDYTSYTYTVGATAADHKDLVISPALRNCTSALPSGSGVAASDATKVNVRLYHVLSRIGFKVAVDNDYTVDDQSSTSTPQYSNRAVTIHNVSLTGDFINTGTFDLTSAVSVSGETITYGTIGGTAATTTYSLFSNGQSFTHTPDGAESSAHLIYDNTDDAAENADDNRYMMIIPGNPGNAATVNVTYEIEGGSETTVSLPLKDQSGNIIEFAAGKAYEFVFTVSNVAVGFNVDVDPWDTDVNENDKMDDDDIPNNLN